MSQGYIRTLVILASPLYTLKLLITKKWKILLGTRKESWGLEAFHWSNTVWRVKERFMDAVLKLDFKAKIAVIKNPADLEKNLEIILAHLIVEKRIATIYLDGKKPKWYEHKLKKVLRDKGIAAKKLKTVNDSQFAGVRLADMAAGLVRSIADGKNLNQLMPYFERLKKKILFSIDI